MSQRPEHENRATNAYVPYNKRKFTVGRNFDHFHNMRPYNNFQYYSTKYNYQRRWNYKRKRLPFHRYQRKTPEGPSRSPSPFSGTEEYNLKKIQEASDMIKKRLLMPETEDAANIPETSGNNIAENENGTKSSKNDNERNLVKSKKTVVYNVEEIHDKIITHITNLSHARKMNLICANSSGYDVAIQQIYKQKRLELSKVLRDMCSNHAVDNSEVINSIIPDIGIKIEDLPLEIIQELSSTLDLNFDEDAVLETNDRAMDESVPQLPEETDECTEEIKWDIDVSEPEIKQERVCEEVSLFQPVSVIPEESTMCTDYIKQEVIDDSDLEMKEERTCDYPMENSDFNVPIGNPEISQKDTFHETQESVEIKPQICDSQDRISVSLQTDLPDTSSVSIQTDNDDNVQFSVRMEDINDLDAAIRTMFEIDKEIARLTNLRQQVFTELQKKQENEKAVEEERRRTPVETVGKIDEAEIRNERKEKQSPRKNKAKNNEKQSPSKTRTKRKQSKTNGDFDILIQEKDVYYEKALEFEPIPEKILIMKVIEDTLLAGSEKGNVYYISALDGTTSAIVHVCNAGITSLCYWTSKKSQLHFLVGSSQCRMYQYNYEKKTLIQLTKLRDSVQCMELAWNCVFMGTAKGHLVRYNIKQNKIEFEERISNEESPVMVLKAAQEGSRRVLLVGMRNGPVCVRDAMSGLQLRTMTELVTPTVYSLVLENSMVYCGTRIHDILVFNFNDGNLVHKHEATNSKGILTMKVSGNLLFAASYNGNIYVYNVKAHTYVGMMEGPGGMILSMEILKNIVILSTLSDFKSLLIPDYILDHNKI